MKPSLLVLQAVAWLLAASAACAGPVGFTRVAVPDGANPPIEVGIWYPTDAQARPTPVGPFVQTVALDAAAKGSRLPLVVISHGTGGDLTGHSDTAYVLAAAGFVAAAPTHTGDNFRDQSRVLDIADRARQLRTVIGFMVSYWRPGTVDASRVGAFGFSAGGFAVLVTAGATPDFRLIGPHCAAHPAFYDCRLIETHGQGTAVAAQTPRPAFVHDTRIRAIVVAAPALGFTFTRQGLEAVVMPVQLWRADDDSVLPYPDYADAVRAGLPESPEMHRVPDADHYDFLAPCSDLLVRAVPMICRSRPGFDRVAFHRQFDDEVTDFFRRMLRVRPASRP